MLIRLPSGDIMASRPCNPVSSVNGSTNEHPSAILADSEGTIVPANEYELSYMMEPLDDIICGKESPFVSNGNHPASSALGPTHGPAAVVQTHMTNTTWMNSYTTPHPIHNHHLQPMTHQIHQIKIHPQGPGTPPDTPPGFSPTNTSHPPSPQFAPQQTTAIVEELWSTSYNRYLEPRFSDSVIKSCLEPLDLRHGPPHLYPDPLDQQPFCVDRKYECFQQRQTQLQMPLMPVKQQQQLHHHHHQQLHHQPAINQQQQQQQQQSAHPLNHPGQMLTASHFEISDDELLGLTVRDLNKRLHSMTKEMQTQVKQRRRTLKNRGYAQSCRTKRQEQKSKLEIENGELKDKLSQINQQLSQTVRENENLRKEREGIIRENHLLRQHQPSSQHQHQQQQHQQQQQHLSLRHQQQQQQQQHHHTQQHSQLSGLHTPQQQTSPQSLYDI